MKNIIIFLLGLILIMFSGCKQSVASSEFVEIKEKLFMQQINDIYLNPDNYSDKTILLEGIYDEYMYESETYSMIYRFGPGCCGDDGTVGFEVVYDGESPSIDDWVKVSGKIEMAENNGYEYLVLNIISLEVLDQRGSEFVYN